MAEKAAILDWLEANPFPDHDQELVARVTLAIVGCWMKS